MTPPRRIEASSLAAPGRLLIVDDEPSLCRAYKRYLEGAGFEVVVANDGDSAVRIFGNDIIDAVLTDIEMPGVDGVELLRRIRGCDDDVPVILATGGPTMETAIAAVRHGALEYLVKPLGMDELVDLMRRAVRLRRLAELRRRAVRLLGEGRIAGV